MLFWTKAFINKRKIRSTFRRRYVDPDKIEFVVTIPGFSGELKKTMTKKEAAKLIKESNETTFDAAAKASQTGRMGVDAFTRTGKAGVGMRDVIQDAIAKHLTVEGNGVNGRTVERTREE